MRNLKVFISVPMNGRTCEEIAKDIEDAKAYIHEKFDHVCVVEIVDNFITRPEDNKQRLYCLGEAIKKIGECDICYFAPGWEKYRGCQVEYEVCNFYDIGIMVRE